MDLFDHHMWAAFVKNQLNEVGVEILFSESILRTQVYVRYSYKKYGVNYASYWECTECGRQNRKWSTALRRKDDLGCGCQRARKYKQDALYAALVLRYNKAKERCRPNHMHAHRYYYRGIQCLFASAEAFVEEVLRVYPQLTLAELKRLQIDRIDNDGNYEAGNIRLATVQENNRNRG